MPATFRSLLGIGLFALVACDQPARVPSPTELAEPVAWVERRIAAHEAKFPEKRSEQLLPALDATLREVVAKRGEYSVESVQAFREAGLLLIRNEQRYDLAEPYIERALHLSRGVFGTEHRETGYALHDLAVQQSAGRREREVSAGHGAARRGT
jgi:hypothetical protein